MRIKQASGCAAAGFNGHRVGAHLRGLCASNRNERGFTLAKGQRCGWASDQTKMPTTTSDQVMGCQSTRFNVVDRQRRRAHLRIINADQWHSDALQFQHALFAHAHTKKCDAFAGTLSNDAIEHAIFMITVLNIIEHQVNVVGDQTS